MIDKMNEIILKKNSFYLFISCVSVEVLMFSTHLTYHCQILCFNQQYFV